MIFLKRVSYALIKIFGNVFNVYGALIGWGSSFINPTADKRAVQIDRFRQSADTDIQDGKQYFQAFPKFHICCHCVISSLLVDYYTK